MHRLLPVSIPGSQPAFSLGSVPPLGPLTPHHGCFLLSPPDLEEGFEVDTGLTKTSYVYKESEKMSSVVLYG